MDFLDWLKLIASVCSGLAVCIPLVHRVVALAKEAHIAEKSWAPVMKIVLELMKDAEKLYSDGASRKQYVMSAIQKTAVYVDYAIDMAIISQMIDDICAASKVVNAKVVTCDVAETEVPADKAGA